MADSFSLVSLDAFPLAARAHPSVLIAEEQTAAAACVYEGHIYRQAQKTSSTTKEALNAIHSKNMRTRLMFVSLHDAGYPDRSPLSPLT